MPQSKPYTDMTFANTTLLQTPLSSTIGTVQHRELRPQAQRTPSEPNEHASPTTASTSHPNGGVNKYSAYTYNRAQGDSRSMHHAPGRERERERGHTYDQDVGPMIPGSFKIADKIAAVHISANMANDDRFHYHRKARQESVMTISSVTRDGVAGGTYYSFAEENVDDDIDGDRDEDEEDGGALYGARNELDEGKGHEQHQQQVEGMQLRSALCRDSLYTRNEEIGRAHV